MPDAARPPLIRVVRCLSVIAITVAAWTLVGCLFALPSIASGDAWRAPLLRSLIDWWSWGLLAPVILYCDRLLPFAHREWFRRVAAHAILSVVFTVAYLYLHTAVSAGLGQADWQRLLGGAGFGSIIGRRFFWVWPIYWLIAGGILAMRYYRQYVSSELRLERLERMSSEARLQSLRLQLDPHFLFNALNTISAQTESNPRLAREMIGHLGSLLRSSLDNRHRQEIPLGEEIAQLEHYLAIQRIRFGDRLTFSASIDDDVRQTPVPALIIQPLVENAVRHGIGNRPRGGSIELRGRREGSDLVLLLCDDGVGFPAGAEGLGTGMGLAITRERLAGMYPGRGRLELRSREPSGTEVELRLPAAVPPAKREARE